MRDGWKMEETANHRCDIKHTHLVHLFTLIFWLISVIIFKGFNMIDLNSENCKLLESVTNNVDVKRTVAMPTFSATIEAHGLKI